MDENILQAFEVIQLINSIDKRAGNHISSWFNPLKFMELPAGRKSEILKLRVQKMKLRNILDILVNPDNPRFGVQVDRAEFMNFLYSVETSPFYFEEDRPVPYEERLGARDLIPGKNAPRVFSMPVCTRFWRQQRMSQVIRGGN